MKYFINELMNMLIIDHVLCILYFTRDFNWVVQKKDDKYASRYIYSINGAISDIVIV